MDGICGLFNERIIKCFNYESLLNFIHQFNDTNIAIFLIKLNVNWQLKFRINSISIKNLFF